tara:strand:+ start:86 stop:235 length:150 start_codon:yes stop_codon:yes gene_type:complete
MKPIKWFIESFIDLCFPPQEGDEEVPFKTKLQAFLFLVFFLGLLLLISN